LPLLAPVIAVSPCHSCKNDKMFLSNSFRDHLIRLSELNEAGNENLQLYRDAADPNIFDRKERVHTT